MSEEEILKECTELAENEHHELGDCWDEEYSSSAIFELIMLYKQTKKELNNLKEIEKSHQEENGELRVEFEKVYEDNLTLVDELKLEKEKNKVLEAKRIWNKGRIEELKKELVQEKEKNKELNEALERSSGRVTELTVENSDLKYQIYHKQQMIDELTQNEEKLKIELGKEQKIINQMAEDRMLPQGCRTLYNVFNKQDVIDFYENL